ncbi:MAG TPA: bifunctional biotin--[acetyl-CoA-carboxylase] ligase/biotin operon repressor BirA [Gammaproteobacteria bacterium]|jgi:BirA family biotin operon repressor/biotin-[acetyl-CoA-carboxylase] ligase|nr:bifunctional biotin--[acetyl-CoA-carboxylase] ligase/biotin operon repressor BirA [Gammaproteobacteria bacterium]
MAVQDEGQQALLRVLADGRFHSGPALGATLGLGRGAVWKRIAKLTDYGIDIDRVRGRGYRLSAPLDLLDADRLRQAMGTGVAERLACLAVLPVVDSTSRWMAERAAGFQQGEAGTCLAECQTAGRGRRGRAWISPFGANLYLSVGWHLRDLPPDVGALSLAAGLAAADALEQCGFGGIGIKWPNDMVHDGRKLGGILVDLQGQPGGACRLVIGVGINVAMPTAAGAAIDQSWVDLKTIGPVAAGLRNRLAGRLIARLLQAVAHYSEQGFTPFADEWRRRDAVAGRAVDVLLADRKVAGTALGVDAQGALRLQTDAGVQRYFSGEVSLRAR